MDDDINFTDFVARRGRRQRADTHIIGCNVDDPVFVMNVEMGMVAGIRIEISPLTVQADLADETRVGELIERVVNGCDRKFSPISKASSFNISGVTCLCLSVNSKQPRAMRCRVGRSPARLKIALTSKACCFPERSGF